MTTDLRCTETFDNHAAAAAASPLMTAASFRGGVAYSQPIVCRAYKDPVILEDARVFQNMLDIEEFYVAATNYFAHTQTEIKPHMRKIVTDWMLEVRDVFSYSLILSLSLSFFFCSTLRRKKWTSPPEGPKLSYDRRPIPERPEI